MSVDAFGVDAYVVINVYVHHFVLKTASNTLSQKLKS